jgi:hypothetical protein
MLRLGILLVIGGLSLALPGTGAAARDGFSPSGLGPTGAGLGPRWHRPFKRHRLPHPPVFLEGRRPAVTVVVQQTVVTAPALPVVPSLLELPVNAGIREPRPVQPAVIVLNEGPSRSAATAAVRRAGASRILKSVPGGNRAQPEAADAPAVGAQIVYLSVPVGR